MTTEEAIKQLNELSVYFDKHVPAMGGEALRMGADALRSQQDRENPKPITLEELRQMNGPVWICYLQETWGPQNPTSKSMSCSRYGFSFKDYGDTWLAYRRPKEN